MELNYPIRFLTNLYEDNQPVVDIICNRRNLVLTKHMDIKCHAVIDYDSMNYIKITKIDSATQLADALTKTKQAGSHVLKIMGHTTSDQGV